MRIPCPYCGERGNEEFIHPADATLTRPEGDAATFEAMHDYVYLRDNPRGPHKELWYHAAGCRRWLVVHRDTATHAVYAVVPASPPPGEAAR